MTRVLLGKLEPMVRLGMTDLLEADGVDVLGAEERPQGLILMAGRTRPDAVVLDLLDPAARALAERGRTAAPETTVILWSRDEDAMEVLDPGAATPRRRFTELADELRAELRAAGPSRVTR